MARGHATSGVAVWLIGCAALQTLGHPVPTGIVVKGALVCAGWALAPDIDHPGSTVSRSGGLITRVISVGFGSFGAALHAWTRTPLDRIDRDGHRTVSHTLLWAVLSGVAVMCFQLAWPAWTAAVVVFMASYVGLGVLLPRGRDWRVIRVGTGLRYPRWIPVPTVFTTAVVMAVVAYRTSPGEGWWLGLAVGVGSAVHCLGDSLTDSACPLLWPVPIRRRRWKPIGTPDAMRFNAGGAVERVVVVPLLTVSAVGGVVWLMWPHLPPL